MAGSSTTWFMICKERSRWCVFFKWKSIKFRIISFWLIYAIEWLTTQLKNYTPNLLEWSCLFSLTNMHTHKPLIIFCVFYMPPPTYFSSPTPSPSQWRETDETPKGQALKRQNFFFLIITELRLADRQLSPSMMSAFPLPRELLFCPWP